VAGACPNLPPSTPTQARASIRGAFPSAGPQSSDTSHRAIRNCWWGGGQQTAVLGTWLFLAFLRLAQSLKQRSRGAPSQAPQCTLLLQGLPKLSCKQIDPAPRPGGTGYHLRSPKVTFGTSLGSLGWHQVETVPGSPMPGLPTGTPLPGPRGAERRVSAQSPRAVRGIEQSNREGTATWGRNYTRLDFTVTNFLSNLCPLVCDSDSTLAPNSYPPSALSAPHPLAGRPPTPPQPRAAKHNSVRIVRGSATKRIWRRRKSIFDHKVNIISRLTVCRIKKETHLSRRRVEKAAAQKGWGWGGGADAGRGERS
jgi:hypothetical protein